MGKQTAGRTVATVLGQKRDWPVFEEQKENWYSQGVVSTEKQGV
jgi:hypothetical protein